MEHAFDAGILSHPDARILLCAVLVLAGIYTSVMCTCFGTLSLGKARADFNAHQDLQRTYDATFQRREDILYHIGGARQRGEHEQAAALSRHLAHVDHDLDVLEQRMRDLDGRSRGRRPKKT